MLNIWSYRTPNHIRITPLSKNKPKWAGWLKQQSFWPVFEICPVRISTRIPNILRLLMRLLSTSKCWDSTLKLDHDGSLPHPFQLNVHYYLITPIYRVWETESTVKSTTNKQMIKENASPRHSYTETVTERNPFKCPTLWSGARHIRNMVGISLSSQRRYETLHTRHLLHYYGTSIRKLSAFHEALS
jgi:hypothetical protein